jgi:hypothetical protein
MTVAELSALIAQLSGLRFIASSMLAMGMNQVARP